MSERWNCIDFTTSKSAWFYFTNISVAVAVMYLTSSWWVMKKLTSFSKKSTFLMGANFHPGAHSTARLRIFSKVSWSPLLWGQHILWGASQAVPLLPHTKHLHCLVMSIATRCFFHCLRHHFEKGVQLFLLCEIPVLKAKEALCVVMQRGCCLSAVKVKAQTHLQL